MNSLDKAANPNDGHGNGSEGNKLEKNTKDKTDLNSVHNYIKSSGAVRIPQNVDKPLIKLKDVWKIYQMGYVDFAALMC